MLRRSALARTVAVICALLQMAMPAVVSVADAWNGRAQAVDAHVRIEAHSEAHCVALDTEACALCEYLSDGALPPASGCPSAPPTRSVSAAPTTTAQVVVRVHATTAQPRAPPVG